MEPIISVRGLGKSYRIQTGERKSYRTLRDDIADFGKGLLKGEWGRSRTEEFWALQDIDLDIYPGEVIGIIGRNGAGKSTLLKILSRVVKPERGEVVLRGRVASLLEVGTGFHPELTGRENIYMSGSVLGMKKNEIKNKFDEIVEFAEVEKFLDIPVKRYSSGMYVRLAFAVAAHLEPEILLVDEVLAVGDANFQKKCLGRMREVSLKNGRTVLFVSHNMTALQSLCDQTILLESGKISRKGDAKEIITQYLKKASNLDRERIWEDSDNVHNNDNVRLYRVCITKDDPDNAFESITILDPIKVEFEFWNFLPNASLNLSFVLYNLEENCVFNSVSESKIYPIGLIRAICFIPENLLNNDIYRIRILIVKDLSIPLLDCENVGNFEVHDIPREGNWYGKWIGVVRPKLKWNFESIKN